LASQGTSVPCEAVEYGGVALPRAELSGEVDGSAYENSSVYLNLILNYEIYLT